ncbi:MAG: sterol desaturase family protein [Geminicoccaceae bacterium]
MPQLFGTWSGQKYFLDKMTYRDLVVAFFTHYSIQVYLLVAALAILATVWLAGGWQGPLLTVAVVLVVYPFAEYVLHRFVLHARFLYKSPYTAKVWKRIHYDHHQNPHDLSVLFGALYTTLPAIALVSMPVGWLVAGAAGATTALATAVIVFSVYEWCHCVQHLPVTPKNTWLREIKRRHLAHHFHSEKGNYGITSGLWDRILGTFYAVPKDMPRSVTAFNLGYTEDERRRYPWVADLSASEDEYAVRRHRRVA